MGRFKGGDGWVKRSGGWRRVGLGICKVGGVGSRSNHTSWILCSAVRTISTKHRHLMPFHLLSAALNHDWDLL